MLNRYHFSLLIIFADKVFIRLFYKTMKNFKPFAILCLFVFLVINVSAQTSEFHFGARAGFNLSTAFVNDASGSKFRPGYNVGVTVEYRLPKNFLIQSALSLSAKGSKQKDLVGSDYIGGPPDFTHTYNQLYLEVPLYGAYRKKVSDKTNIVVGAGPYFAYGIGGRTKKKLNSGIWSGGITQIEWDTFGDGVFDEDRDWLRGEVLNRFDFGAGIKADLEYYKYVFGVELTSSIINIMENHDYVDLKYRNFNINISLGYKF